MPLFVSQVREETVTRRSYRSPCGCWLLTYKKPNNGSKEIPLIGNSCYNHLLTALEIVGRDKTLPEEDLVLILKEKGILR